MLDEAGPRIVVAKDGAVRSQGEEIYEAAERTMGDDPRAACPPQNGV